MSTYAIEIDDSAIIEQINTILNRIVNSELSRRYSGSQDVIRQCVKELIYEHKDEILDECITKATKELVRKGLPKLLERFTEDEG